MQTNEIYVRFMVNPILGNIHIENENYKIPLTVVSFKVTKFRCTSIANDIVLFNN